MTSPVPGHDVPAGDEPGSGSTPTADGQGTVDLSDRTGAGSPAANQTKVEPVPPTDKHPSPASSGPVTGLDLDDLDVGSADPQAPAHRAVAAGGSHASAYDERVADAPGTGAEQA